MKYALGNMLNGAGGLNADGLSLDLQFAADKTLTARKGPTPVFTRASSGTFVGSDGLIQSAANNAPRFDHDPITLACKGLLIEESRTNLVLRSEGFSAGSWQKSGVTITADSVASPDGAVTADLLVEDVGLSAHIVQQSAPSITAGQPYTFSVFAKPASHTSYQMALSNTAFGGGLFANFILTGSGSVGTSFGVTTKIESFPSGWYRCSVTIASVAGGTGGFSTIVINNNNSSATRLPSYLGTGAQAVYLYGAQLEAGSFPTSYIPTTTAAVTRSADVCSITLSAFSGFYNQAEGTILAGYLFRTNSAGRPFYIGDGTSSTNTMEAFNGGSGVTSNVFSGGAQQYTRDVVATNNSMVKTALAVAASNAMLAVNSTLATSGGGLMPVGVNQLVIGNRPDGARNINGHISVVRYFRKRLPNAKLQTLTT